MTYMPDAWQKAYDERADVVALDATADAKEQLLRARITYYWDGRLDYPQEIRNAWSALHPEARPLRLNTNTTGW